MKKLILITAIIFLAFSTVAQPPIPGQQNTQQESPEDTETYQQTTEREEPDEVEGTQENGSNDETQGSNEQRLQNTDSSKDNSNNGIIDLLFGWIPF